MYQKPLPSPLWTLTPGISLVSFAKWSPLVCFSHPCHHCFHHKIRSQGHLGEETGGAAWWYQHWKAIYEERACWVPLHQRFENQRLWGGWFQRSKVQQQLAVLTKKADEDFLERLEKGFGEQEVGE